MAIGIIDGVFDHVPSVWHKEVLWAMSEGIHVFGSASMGALRAAELAAFGMIGVGEIFRNYQNGSLEDDDEVAVVHGTREDGFCAMSDAMVNIRQTLLRAENDRVLDPAVRAALERIAKSLPYPDALLRPCPRNRRPVGLTGLRGRCLSRPGYQMARSTRNVMTPWTMLREMRVALLEGLAPKMVDYKFERTVVWNSLVNSADFCTESVTDSAIYPPKKCWPSLWADPDLCLQAYQYAAIRHLVRQAAQLSGVTVSQEKIAAVEAAFRADRGIGEQPEFEHWLSRHHMTPADFADLIQHEALQHESALTPCPFPHRWMIDWLRISGQFEATASAALAKKNGSAGFRSARY